MAKPTTAKPPQDKKDNIIAALNARINLLQKDYEYMVHESEKWRLEAERYKSWDAPSGLDKEADEVLTSNLDYLEGFVARLMRGEV